MNLDYYIKKMPKNYYICQKKLWVGDLSIDIDHIDDNLYKPLNYEKAFRKMLVKLNIDNKTLNRT